MIHGLSDDISEDFRRVFSRYPDIEKVMIFGSRAKGHYRDGSDIDLAVFAPAMPDSTFTRLWREVDALPVVFKVDLLHWDRLGNPGLKEKVLLEGRPFFTPSHR
jgi:proline iminopeptidase